MNSRSNIIFRVVFTSFLIIFVSMFVINIFRSTASSTPVTFTGFLDFVSNTQPLIPNWSFASGGVGGDWGLFEGFRYLINFVYSGLRFVAWLGTQAINVVAYLGQFLAFVFA